MPGAFPPASSTARGSSKTPWPSRCSRR